MIGVLIPETDFWAETDCKGARGLSLVRFVVALEGTVTVLEWRRGGFGVESGFERLPERARDGPEEAEGSDAILIV